ncbi:MULTISPECIES: polyprenol monophosphomannose synthase [unclassified Actinomyces]|uniref:polyprenol monophosphomannose synthase n=1 Tax=unclassified Actinomyces TaxID=2609248 RepID=UPI002017BAA3|nr:MULTISPECIES: polyprenol monophosphomannose synthase [unclassified Actinomyces]MCL3778191.1 polyprenol monophosphomannose synthase [Actinomyces sp. AC-20-1]MCL3788894.1 polyprenol monophosphomannose synthase [Actinomyces sp. 187325]MCL3792206.1 polyprenol monophosphomannose synthase [Actinomyces sp. 186855]MCL3794167.1 polyprenol monophosphomannose synthase [Actinomyces sp. 217892]
MRTVVVIPTYNEIESLPGALERVRAAAPQAHVLVVDDSSPDGTGAFADARAAEDDHVHVLHRQEKNGLGPAYLAGFAWALDAGYELVVEMDADGSHRAEDLALLLQRAQMSDAPDLVIGSRWVSGGATEGWDARRVALSRAGNLYINAMLGTRVKDATAGFRVYTASVLRRLDLSRVEALGYGFQVNMTLLVEEAGGRVVEMPITFVEREAGRSKLSGGIFTEELALVTKWGLRRRAAQLGGLVQQVRERAARR